MGVSGFIEVVALVLWGYELFANIREGKRLEKQSSVLDSFAYVFDIQPNSKVGDVLARYPQALEIFIRHGFTPLRNPVLRKTMARVVTVEQVCRREGVDMDALLSELTRLIEGERRESAKPISITRTPQVETV
jgi:hypothetical protein